MWLSRYICLFFIYSFMGWIYETLYCTIKNGKWENRGFLFGPA
ncbi:MAG: metal-dependent phosphohydrolase, partial [Lachnospiraceae bacterium]|nr:metal-dependent phosphohydrolase [Lachnospiraceae bacterium]